MAKYIHSDGERVKFEGESIKLDSKNRMYVEFLVDTTIINVGVIPKGKKIILHNVEGVIRIKESLS